MSVNNLDRLYDALRAAAAAATAGDTKAAMAALDNLDAESAAFRDRLTEQQNAAGHEPLAFDGQLSRRRPKPAEVINPDLLECARRRYPTWDIQWADGGGVRAKRGSHDLQAPDMDHLWPKIEVAQREVKTPR